MAESTWVSWRESLYFLRRRVEVPAALANAATLAVASPRWNQHLVARTSMHDLLFTIPGEEYPFQSAVRVQWSAGTNTISRWQGDTLVEEHATEADNVDTTLDSVLERLLAPAAICRRCATPIRVFDDQAGVFEGMHYSCFHYEFEHNPFDPDEECNAEGCPATSIPRRKS